jgi:hypothetical protein
MNEYGKENVDLVYIETGQAHVDNKRFISDFERVFDCKITIAKNKKGYTDVYDVIRKERYVNGVAGARCTKELKKEVRFDLEQENKYTNQIFGFEFVLKEINRAIRFSEQYDVGAIYPLIEHELDKDMCAYLISACGIRLPEMYILGYNNNNCIGCVKGGKGYWNKIRQDFPEQFNKMAIVEREIGHSCIKNTFLDELKPNKGRHKDFDLPDCGTFCEIEYAHILDKKAQSVFAGKLKMKQATQLTLF